MGRRSKYSAEFKQDAVSRMGQDSKTVTELAEELGVRRKFLYLWRERLQAGGKVALERGPEGRQEASRKNQFHSQWSVQLSCGSQNWSGC